MDIVEQHDRPCDQVLVDQVLDHGDCGQMGRCIQHSRGAYRSAVLYRKQEAVCGADTAGSLCPAVSCCVLLCPAVSCCADFAGVLICTSRHFARVLVQILQTLTSHCRYLGSSNAGSLGLLQSSIPVCPLLIHVHASSAQYWCKRACGKKRDYLDIGQSVLYSNLGLCVGRRHEPGG